MIINDTPSATFPLICGVPQGSVIGPLLFVLYTSQLSKVINSHQGIHHAMYADDTQIYITLKPNGKDGATRKLSSCLEDIRFWSSNNILCLNERKSEMIHITSKFRNTDSFSDLVTGDGSLKGSEYVRDLGVLIDKILHFSSILKTFVNLHLLESSKLGKLGNYLTDPQLQN